MSRYLHKASGYVIIYEKGKWIREHIKIFCEYHNIGVLPKGCIIHHLNGIKSDNRIENLELTTRSQHRKYHPLTTKIKMKISNGVKNNLPRTIFKKGNIGGNRFEKGKPPVKHQIGCLCFRCTKNRNIIRPKYRNEQR